MLGETQAKQETTRGTCPSAARARGRGEPSLFERERANDTSVGKCSNVFWGASSTTTTTVSSSRQEMKSSFLCVCSRECAMPVRSARVTNS